MGGHHHHLNQSESNPSAKDAHVSYFHFGTELTFLFEFFKTKGIFGYLGVLGLALSL